MTGLDEGNVAAYRRAVVGAPSGPGGLPVVRVGEARRLVMPWQPEALFERSR